MPVDHGALAHDVRVREEFVESRRRHAMNFADEPNDESRLAGLREAGAENDGHAHTLTKSSDDFKLTVFPKSFQKTKTHVKPTC